MNKEKNYGKRHFSRSGDHLLNYRVSAIIRKENKILVHHIINSEHYILPGGRVKEVENTIEALQREIKEEMALDTQYVKPVSFIENFFEMKGKKYHELLVTHELEFKDKLVYNQNIYDPAEEEKKGILEFIWIDLKDIENINFVPKEMKKIVKSKTNNFLHIINDDR